MANHARGQLSVKYNGSDFILALSVNSICDLEEKSGQTITEIIGDIGTPAKTSMIKIRLLFWAMMLESKPDATLQDAGVLVTSMAGRHDEIMAKAIQLAFPDPVPDGAGGDEEKT